MKTVRRSLIVLAIAGPFVGLLLGLVGNLASSQARWPGVLDTLRVHPWRSLGILVALSICLAILAVVVDRPTPGSPNLAEIADGLAVATRKQWLYEAEWRRLYDPYPMPVQWSAADPDLLVEWSALIALASSSPKQTPTTEEIFADPAELAGSGNELARVLSRIPTGRLVVLGERGSGKTILLVRLILDLLEARRPGEPVPILLPVASWNPIEKDLRAWIEDWITTENSALAKPAADGYGVSRARALLEAGLIIPILDGFDEIPEAVRGPTINRINEAMMPNQHLVLASRIAEYRAAVRPAVGAETQLVGAAGIELLPVRPSVIGEYLKASAGGPVAARRWDGVIEIINESADHPLARTLSTPLMAALVRAVYNPRLDEVVTALPHHPAELLDAARFSSREELEIHLFDRFLPASYRPHPDKSRRCRWATGKASQWLQFLAKDLEHRQGGAIDIAWWNFGSSVPWFLIGGVVALLAFVAGAIGLPFPGFGLGLIAALSVGFLIKRWQSARASSLTLGLAGGILGGQLAAVTAVFLLGMGDSSAISRLGSLIGGGLAVGISIAPLRNFWTAIGGAYVGELVIGIYENAEVFHPVRDGVGSWANIINGVGLGLAAGLAAGLANRKAPARSLRWSWLGLLCGIATGVAAGFITWIQVGRSGGLMVGVAVTIAGSYGGGFFFEARESDVTRESNPLLVLRRDRKTFIISCLGLGVALAIGSGLTMALGPDPNTGQPNGLAVGLKVGLANVVAAGLAFGFLQASWGSYTLARLWLAATGRLPWRLMGFLIDAHKNRGVLRQVGAVYQFRHVELQRHLSRDARSAEV